MPPAQRPSPPRSEVIMVISCTLTSLVIGGVVGWLVFSNLGGVLLGLVGGLFGAFIPIAVGYAVLQGSGRVPTLSANPSSSAMRAHAAV
jgi:hypothetical protein